MGIQYTTITILYLFDATSEEQVIPLTTFKVKDFDYRLSDNQDSFTIAITFAIDTVTISFTFLVGTVKTE